MKSFYAKKVTIDEIQYYLTTQVIVIPALYDHFLDCLNELERFGHASLVPSAILERYHRRLNKAA